MCKSPSNLKRSIIPIPRSQAAMAAAAFRGGSCWQRRRRLAPLVVVVVVVLLALVVGPVAGAYKKYLFLDDLESQVEELVGAAELDRVKERREPYAVMFYSPSCPHCTHFAPTWSNVAAAMAGTGIHVAGVSCLAEPSVCHQEEIRGYPTLKAFGLQDPNASADAGGVVIRTDQTEDKIVAWLKNHYRSHFSSAVAAGAGAAAAASLAEAGRKEKEGEGAAMGREAAAAEEKGSGILSAGDLRRRRASDAFTSLRFAMDHDVFLGATELKEGALETFKNLLRALVLLFPGAERRKALNGLLGAIEPLEVMGIAEWEERVERHMGPLVRKEEGEGDYKWTLAQPDAGYTGGLWFLFHILTARSAMASAEDQDPRVQPPHVLRVVHGFVEHFFGCEECKRHFLGAYEEVKETWEPQGAKGAVLWIWDLHDKVNVRLSKPRWPSRGECPRCWKGSAPQYDALYETLIDAYDIRDPHLLSGGGAASSRAGEDEGETSKGQIVSHDFVFIGLLVLIVLGAAVWKLERKLSLGRRKKQGDGRLPMYGRVNLADNV